MLKLLEMLELLGMLAGNSANAENYWNLYRGGNSRRGIYYVNGGCKDINAVNYNPLAEYEIDTYYELNTDIYEFNLSLSCRYSFEKILNNELVFL